jgi:hypothetical protein
MKSIHLKIDYDEAISIKRDSLILEKELLQTIGHIKSYNDLRRKEFMLKNQIKKDLAIIESSLKQISECLPIEELNMLPKKTESKSQMKRIMIPRERRVIESKQTEVEKELEEIKRKLAMLG